MATTWFLIADASRAKLYERNHKHEVSRLHQFDHPVSRSHDGDIATEGGRTRQTGSAPYAAEKDEESARRHTEYTRFANEIAEYLKKAAVQNLFQELVLVASPNFLGALRPHLHPKVLERVVTTLDKDLTELDERELLAREDVFNVRPYS